MGVQFATAASGSSGTAWRPSQQVIILLAVAAFCGGVAMDSQIKGALRSTSKQVVVAVQRWQLSSATDGLPDTQPYAGAPVVRSS